MALDIFDPCCRRPEGLVAPVRLDPAGVEGPTRGQARGRRWTHCAPGWLVPCDRPDCVEQRILEQAARVRGHGGVTGWAALRWQGASYFDGAELDASSGEVRPLPVPLVVPGSSLRRTPDCAVSKTQLAPTDRHQVAGIWVATPQRALFDETVRHRNRLWRAVEAIDMTYAAGLVSQSDFEAYVVHRSAWTGVPFVRRACELASPDARSPRETWLRLVWVLNLGLPTPLCNRSVYSLDGRLLAVVDLLDPVAGLVVEYDGAHHDRPGQRRRDRVRESALRDVGLEYVAIVTGDRIGDAAFRIHQARARAPFTPADRRSWTLDAPAAAPQAG